MGTESDSTFSVPATSAARCPHCGTLFPSPRADRRFALSDAMILVAASAVAFVMVRPIVNGMLPREPGWTRHLAIVMGGLVSWTPTLLFLRLRAPRPPLHRLTRQPGFAASLAGTSIIALAALAIGLLALVRVSRQGAVAGMTRLGTPMSIPPPYPSWWLGVVLHFGAVVGPAIIAAWLLLALSGRRRPPRGWIDPLGRVLGVLWIALFVINCCARLSYLRH